MNIAKRDVLRDQILRDRAAKYPIVAARRYFQALRPVTDLHTAYSQALAYYARLAGTGLLIMSLIVPIYASAQPWQVDYTTRGDISQVTKFYGPGAYEFNKGPDYVTVYLNTGPVNGSQGGFQYIGTYGPVTAAGAEILARIGHPEVAPVPADLPPIVFTGLFDAAVATKVDNPEVGVPELAILGHLPAIPDFGTGMKQALRTGYQRATAYGTTGLLHALGTPVERVGTVLHLRALRVNVLEWCAGVDLLKFLIIAGVALCVAARLTPWRGLVLLALIFAIALEVNVLRTTATTMGYDLLGAGDEAWSWKERFGVGAMALGLMQVAGIVLVLRRRRAC